MFPNQDNGRFLVQEDGTLVIDSIRRSDAGEYSCHALSQAGSIETTMRIDVRGSTPHRLIIVSARTYCRLACLLVGWFVGLVAR